MLISPRMATPCPPLSSLPAPPLQHPPSPPPCEWDDHDRRTPNGNADKSDLPPKKFKPLPWHSKVAYLKRCLLLNNLLLRLTPSINSFIERYVVTFCCWGIKYLRRLLFNNKVISTNLALRLTPSSARPRTPRLFAAAIKLSSSLWGTLTWLNILMVIKV